MCVWKELTLNIQRQLEFDMGRNRHHCRPEELCVTQVYYRNSSMRNSTSEMHFACLIH